VHYTARAGPAALRARPVFDSVLHERSLVVLGADWLPRQLVIDRHSFRRVGIFSVVHAPARAVELDGQVMVVLGSIRSPKPFATTLDEAVQRIASPPVTEPPKRPAWRALASGTVALTATCGLKASNSGRLPAVR